MHLIPLVSLASWSWSCSWSWVPVSLVCLAVTTPPTHRRSGSPDDVTSGFSWLLSPRCTPNHPLHFKTLNVGLFLRGISWDIFGNGIHLYF
ncbi:hypothetical protein FKM82_014291 [Ascaphus truei]